MWFRATLMMGLTLGVASPAGAQTWTACYAAASDSLTPEAHRAVREAAAAHLVDQTSTVQGWSGVTLRPSSSASATSEDWPAYHRFSIELRRLRVSPARIDIPDGITDDPPASGRDSCIEVSLAIVPVRTWHLRPVFFREDSAAITEMERILLESAFVEWLSAGTRIVLNGHDDTRGSSASSLTLSEQQTEAVAEALVRMGVRWTDFEQRSWGEDRLVRPTPDGVVEPLNRSVVIDVVERPEPAR